MKSNLQIGHNTVTDKFALSQPGEGQIEITRDELDEIVNFVVKHDEENLPKGEQNDSSANEH